MKLLRTLILSGLLFSAPASAGVLADKNCGSCHRLKAEEIENNSNQLLNFTNIIKQNSMDIKKDIIEHLWKVIISDNKVDQYESNLMRRVCGLIYFPDKESAEIKLKLLNTK